MAKKVAKDTKAEKIEDKKEQKHKKKDNKVKSTWLEFKKFINRGNVVDMSIGVVIGAAFGAIVTAVTNIFLSIATWGVPGGLKGLITILPAANEAQAGMSGIGQSFSSGKLIDMAKILYNSDPEHLTYKTISDAQSVLTSKYTLHGGTYVYNGAAVIDWGTLINTILTFIIIALVLFVILKAFTKFNKMREETKKKMLEEYYKKHPEERPEPVNAKLPEPTEKELLKEIVKELKIQNGTYKAPKVKKK